MTELAQKQRDHERELARGDRLYDKRAPVYESVMQIVHAVKENVEATEPIMRFRGEAEPPPYPGPDEFRIVQVKLRTHGSIIVGDAFDDFGAKATSFYLQAGVVKMLRDQHGAIGDEMTKLQSAREQVRDAMRVLEGLVSEELASL
jgi:hypothetical protein